MMNGIIKIEEREGRQIVNARDLWMALESKQQFSDWIKGRLEGFSEGQDYLIHKIMNNPSGGRPTIDYYLTIETGKHVAMLERNEKGREIRQYFIEVEQAWNTPEMMLIRGLQAAQAILEQKTRRIAELEPKAEFFDQVADSRTAITMREVAAALNIPGWGRNKIFDFLRRREILDNNNIPYREYQDRGYFRVVERSWNDDKGESHIILTTLVYQRGLDYIRKTILATKDQAAFIESTSKVKA